MKVLMLTHNYPNKWQPHSGIFIKNLVESLRREGVTVEVATISSKFNIFYDRIGWQAIKKHKPDIIWAHWWIPAGVLAMWTKIPYIVTLHGTDVELAKRWYLKPLFQRVLKQAKIVHCVSYRLYHQIADYVKDWKKINVRPMPYNDDIFYDRCWSKNQKKIVLVGRLSHEKGIDKAIRWMWGKDAYLEIVGDGPERRRLEKLAINAGVDDKVSFLGWKTQEQIADILSDAGLLIAPSRRDGFNMSVLEALACGVNVDVSDECGVIDFKDSDITQYSISESGKFFKQLLGAVYAESNGRETEKRRAQERLERRKTRRLRIWDVEEDRLETESRKET